MPLYQWLATLIGCSRATLATHLIYAGQYMYTRRGKKFSFKLYPAQTRLLISMSFDIENGILAVHFLKRSIF